MATSKTIPNGPSGNVQPSAESPWTPKEPGDLGYPGAPTTKDPRGPGDTSNITHEDYPGSQPAPSQR
jgi:hypothetical protein